MEHSRRQHLILEELKESGAIRVRTLADRFSVAEMTVRRDLEQLERKGLLVRRYGGALKAAAADSLFSFAERQGMHKVEKKAVGLAASGLIRDNETVFIDCGSTPFQIAVHLAGRALRIITNSLPVVSELIHAPGIRITFIGGEIVNDRRSSQGPVAEKVLSAYRADKAFIGADGVSLKNGLSAYNEPEGLVSRKMADQAKEVYLVTDSSKLERDSFFKYAPLDCLTAIITDSRADGALVAGYRRQGIKVILA